MLIAIDDTVAAVKAMWRAETGRDCPFHLSPCRACGAPSFQEPCPTCNAYRQEDERPADLAARRESLSRRGIGSRDDFIRRVGQSGGIGAWYFASYRGTVAYGDGKEPASPVQASFRDMIEGLMARASALDWPDAGAIWDRVTLDGQSLHGAYAEDRLAWSELAVGHYGEGGFRQLENRHETGQPWYPWPENCPEGRSILREHGERELARIGIGPVAQAEDTACGFGR